MLDYEQSRRIFLNLIDIFRVKEPKKERIDIFEQDVKQVINYKSEINFELFVSLFDLLINYRKEYANGYTPEVVIDLYRKSIKGNKKNQNKKDITDYIDYAQTLDLVIRTYSFVDENFVKTNHEHENFDIFLSHKYSNKYFNLIVFYVLHYYYDLSVYVDWIHNRDVNRIRLSSRTEDLLSKRLNQSCNLLFFNMELTGTTHWMVWEIGYFSGARRNSIGILDLSDYYGKNRTSVEVLSSAHRFIFNNHEIIEEASKSNIDLIFNCKLGEVKNL
ncbi:MAG: hypothetical protein RBR97_19315 [Bacteroidales bacterium]|jgi:hypothetical protein|nr:hypothetical protein [Bacteroidales bacterium]